jgi:hypothetical protein
LEELVEMDKTAVSELGGMTVKPEGRAEMAGRAEQVLSLFCSPSL